MSDLRERFQELADLAALHSQVPGPEVVRRRVRRRRLRLAGGTAALVALAMVAVVGVGRLADRPAPLAPTPTTLPARWVPSVVPLPIQAQPGPYPMPDPGGIVGDVTSLVSGSGCQGPAQVRLWARTEGQVWLIAASPPRPGRSRVCWASGLMGAGGGGALGTQAPSAGPLQVTYAGGGDRHLGVVSGTVTKRAVRLRVLFHKGPPLDVAPVEAGDEFPVNFWAGLFMGTGPPRAKGQLPEPAVDRILAFDQAGNQVAACRARLGPANTCRI
jgi:hypothetical protein